MKKKKRGWGGWMEVCTSTGEMEARKEENGLILRYIYIYTYKSCMGELLMMINRYGCECEDR